MAKVYQFTIYDISTDHSRKSRRYATLEAIKAANGAPLEETAVEVDDSLIGAEVPGMSAIGFNPNWQSGFQKTVSR